MRLKNGRLVSLESERVRVDRVHNVLKVPASKKVAFLESPCWSSVYEKSGDKIVYR